jgi:hypothetical protein
MIKVQQLRHHESPSSSHPSIYNSFAPSSPNKHKTLNISSPHALAFLKILINQRRTITIIPILHNTKHRLPIHCQIPHRKPKASPTLPIYISKRVPPAHRITQCVPTGLDLSAVILVICCAYIDAFVETRHHALYRSSVAVY